MSIFSGVVGRKTIFCVSFILGVLLLTVIIKPGGVEYVYREVYTYTSPSLIFLPPPVATSSIVVPELKIQKAVIETPPVIRKLRELKKTGIVKPLPRIEIEKIIPESGPATANNTRELYDILHGCAMHGITEVTLNDKTNVSVSDMENSVYGQTYMTRSTNADGTQTWKFFLNDFSRLMRTVYDDGNNWVNLTQLELEALQQSLTFIEKSAGIKAGMSDYERAKRVHDALISRIDYHDLNDDSSVFYLARDKFVIYALTRDKGICEGYAQAYGYLLSLVGVESLIVSGWVASIPAEKEKSAQPFKNADIGAHAWNIVKIGNQWGHVDVTWDDGGGASAPSYKYFGKSDSWMARHSNKGDIINADNTRTRVSTYFDYRTFGDMDGFMKNGRVIDSRGGYCLKLWDSPAQGWGRE